MHENKRVLIGVTGGIAAYKSPVLVREFVRRGCDARVVMTRAAAEFVTALTLQAVSGHPVRRELLDAQAEAGMGHIELARWAEVIVIAPASADCIARLAQGRADELLTAVVLAAGEDVEVAVAPAMNRCMWESAATQDNLARLAKRGVRIIGPAAGAQACGEHGPGRMLEPVDIAAAVIGDAPAPLLAGARAVVTAGPTWEALDPVRGITNRSSGKMGYALARAARDFGAQVELISGPVALDAPVGVRRVAVVSAAEMFEAAMAAAAEADLFIGVAAVADYRPATVAAGKMAKRDARMTVELVRNADILAAVAGLRRAPFTLGFAAETHDVIARARAKLHTKNADAIAANRVGDGGGDGDIHPRHPRSPRLNERGGDESGSGGGDGDGDGDGAGAGDGDGGGDIPPRHPRSLLSGGGDGAGDGAGDAIGGDENQATLLFHARHGRPDVALPRADKYRIAVQLIEHIAPLMTRGDGDGDGDDARGDGAARGDGDGDAARGAGGA